MPHWSNNLSEPEKRAFTNNWGFRPEDVDKREDPPSVLNRVVDVLQGSILVWDAFLDEKPTPTEIHNLALEILDAVGSVS